MPELWSTKDYVTLMGNWVVKGDEGSEAGISKKTKNPSHFIFFPQIALRHGTSQKCFLPILDLLEGECLSLYPSAAPFAWSWGFCAPIYALSVGEEGMWIPPGFLSCITPVLGGYGAPIYMIFIKVLRTLKRWKILILCIEKSKVVASRGIRVKPDSNRKK